MAFVVEDPVEVIWYVAVALVLFQEPPYPNARIYHACWTFIGERVCELFKASY